jgi:hypothetical protein
MSFENDPRAFALEMVENQLVTADHLLLCCLKYMSHDDVRDMLDTNELSPRFDGDERDICIDCGGTHISEGTCLSCQLDDWLDTFDDSDYDISAMRSDVSTNNLETGDDSRAEEYKHENIIRASIVNGNFTQAKEQCIRYGYDFDEMRRLHG